MDKTSKEKIKQLKKSKKYDEIFLEFGRKAYNKNTPSKYKKEDKKRLKQEARYEDIYNKYGESEYNKLLVKAMYNEIKEEKGTAKAILWRIGQRIIFEAKQLGIISAFSLLAATETFALNTKSEISENAIKYSTEIEQYNKNISEYAKQVKSMNLSDIETFMKVMDDMWKNIQGYAQPEKSILGFFELDLATEEGYGVCRNMASDIAKKLNEINPEYNARTITVYMDTNDNFQVANIQRNILQSNETVVQEEQKNDSSTINDLKEKTIKMIGNHMVTLVDMPQYNCTLALDPTNPSIGIYQDGEITMFNSVDETDTKYNTKEYVNATFFRGGNDGIRDTIKEYVSSFDKPNVSIDDLKKMFGVKAQNKALEQVRNKSIEKEKDFRESLKVDLNIQGQGENINNNNLSKNKEIYER